MKLATIFTSLALLVIASVANADDGQWQSLFVVEDHDTSPARYDEWFEYHILVSGKRIVIKVNGKTTVDYTEPVNPERPDSWEERVLSHGLIAQVCAPDHS